MVVGCVAWKQERKKEAKKRGDPLALQVDIVDLYVLIYLSCL